MLLIPAIHFLVSILLVGAGLLLVLQEKIFRKNDAPPGNILLAVSLGVLFNTLQFGLVLLVYRKFPLHSQTFLAVAKYIMDLMFLTFILLRYNKKYRDLLKNLLRILAQKENLALLILSVIVGIAAVLHFPHVHDSGQLMTTNRMLQQGNNFLAAKRYGLGFSALFYFPAALFRDIPMGTLASGFKLFLLAITGLSVIYGMEKLSTVSSAVSKFLYFSIIISSYFGLYGMITLGKDSAWAVLFSLIFIFSLFRREPGENALEPCLYFFCAVAFGMIAIPFLAIFCALFAVMRFLPGKISGNKIFFTAAVATALCLCFTLMPVRLAIDVPPHLQPMMGKHSFWPPTNGHTSFYSYLFAFKKNECNNSTPILIVGMLGILLLPLMKNRFSSIAVKSAGLFIPAAALETLLLTLPARGFFPDSRADKIPFTPFSTFDAWNLIKDIPQWYAQIILGIFFILCLDAFIKKITTRSKAARRMYLGISILTIAMVLSANFSNILALKNPAYFYSYGGNKNKNYALILENIYRNPNLKRINVMNDTTSLPVDNFFWDIGHYVCGKKVRIIKTLEPGIIPSLMKDIPFMLIGRLDSLSVLREELSKSGRFYIYELEYFKDHGEGIYVISAEKTNFPCTCFSSSGSGSPSASQPSMDVLPPAALP
jgi:hypothetical protein